MIEVTCDGTKVVVTLKTVHPISGKAFRFVWDAGVEWAASMLWWHLYQRLGAELERIRREAYAEGWNDAKAKKGKKQTWFSSRW